MSSPDVPAAPRQRGGRDLPAAIGVGVGLAGAVIVSLFFVKALFVLVVVTAGAVAIWELSSALAKVGIAVPLPPLMAGGLATLAAAYVGGTEAIAIGAALTVLGVFVYLLWRYARLPLWQAALLGCAVVTGFGAVRNAARVEIGEPADIGGGVTLRAGKEVGLSELRASSAAC